jgi:peptidoglycan/LPS O-acetylase OafA/YrhL
MSEIKRLRALDGIRGIAAIIIAFFWHYKAFFETDKPFYIIGYWAYNYGWMMVDLFFILSGFVFYYVYADQIKANKLGIVDFCILRFSRLYPIHLLTLCIVAGFKIIQKIVNSNIYMYNEYRYNILDFLLNIPMLQNGWVVTIFSFNAPSWSISVEIMMYFLFFYFFYYSKNSKKYLINSVIMIYLGVVIYISDWNTGFFNNQIARGLIGFFIGIITAEVYLNYYNSIKYKKFILLLCYFGIFTTTIIPIIIGYDRIPKWPLITSFGLFPSLIIIILSLKYLSKIFSSKPLLYFGELSYSIYLFHYPSVLIIINLTKFFNLSFDYSTKIFYIGYFIFVICVSHISHYYFEIPVQNILRKRYIGSSGSAHNRPVYASPPVGGSDNHISKEGAG